MMIKSRTTSLAKPQLSCKSHYHYTESIETMNVRHKEIEIILSALASRRVTGTLRMCKLHLATSSCSRLMSVATTWQTCGPRVSLSLLFPLLIQSSLTWFILKKKNNRMKKNVTLNEIATILSKCNVCDFIKSLARGAVRKKIKRMLSPGSPSFNSI